MLQMFIVFGSPPSSCEAFSVAYKRGNTKHAVRSRNKSAANRTLFVVFACFSFAGCLKVLALFFFNPPPPAFSSSLQFPHKHNPRTPPLHRWIVSAVRPHLCRKLGKQRWRGVTERNRFRDIQGNNEGCLELNF